MESKRSRIENLNFRKRTFNRTSMESKHHLLSRQLPHTQPFNRTSMESKRSAPCLFQGSSDIPFNRTSMESKPQQQREPTGTDLLLIEPVWNRNSS